MAKNIKAKKDNSPTVKGGRVLKRKNPFVRALRLTAIVVVVMFIGLLLYHYRDNMLMHKVMVNFNPQEKVDLNDIIARAAQDLGVDEKNYEVHVLNDHIKIDIGINKSIFDLLLANSILTGKVQNAGGTLDYAREHNNGRSQHLQFSHVDSKYPFLVKLSYGDYAPKATEIFLIVDDFGSYDNDLLTDFCALPPEVTFAILPNEPYHESVMHKAAATGHDIIIHIPMEPIDIKNNNPGNNAILVEYSPSRIKNLTQGYIEKLPLAIAANNHMGSLATSRTDIMRPLLQELKKQDLFFIDSVTTPNTVVKTVAREELIATWSRDLFLDDRKLSPELLETKLNKLDEIAKRNDQIFVIGHCHFRTKLEFIQKFIDRAQESGYKFSGVSALIKSKEVINA